MTLFRRVLGRLKRAYVKYEQRQIEYLNLAIQDLSAQVDMPPTSNFDRYFYNFQQYELKRLTKKRARIFRRRDWWADRHLSASARRDLG